jgi:hypothetical protein
LRGHEDFLRPLDAWIAKQKDQPSRPEAIRRLVELGLNDAPKIVKLLTPKTENNRTADRRDVDALAVEDFSIHRMQSYFAFTFASAGASGKHLDKARDKLFPAS